MGDYSPVNGDSFAITLTAGGTITGGLLVKSSGANDTVVLTTTATTDQPIGVAAHDAVSGNRVTVLLLPGYYHEIPIENGATLSAGSYANISAVTAGMVGSAAATRIGVVLRGGTGNAGGTVKARILGL